MPDLIEVPGVGVGVGSQYIGGEPGSGDWHRLENLLGPRAILGIELGVKVWPFLEMSPGPCLPFLLGLRVPPPCWDVSSLPNQVALGDFCSTWHSSLSPYTSSLSICLPSGRETGEDFASHFTVGQIEPQKDSWCWTRLPNPLQLGLSFLRPHLGRMWVGFEG